MDSRYILIVINLIGLFLLFISRSAIAELSSGIVLNTFQENNVAECDHL